MKALMTTIRQVAMVSAAVVLFMGSGVANAITVPLDLTGDGSSGSIANAVGAGSGIFTQGDCQAAGTGYIDPFVRIDNNGSVQTPEQGYNTDLNNILDNKDGIWTHELQLSAVPVVDGYRQFLLDINQTGTSSLLNMTAFQLYLRNTAITESRIVAMSFCEPRS